MCGWITYRRLGKHTVIFTPVSLRLLFRTTRTNGVNNDTPYHARYANVQRVVQKGGVIWGPGTRKCFRQVAFILSSHFTNKKIHVDLISENDETTI